MKSAKFSYSEILNYFFLFVVVISRSDAVPIQRPPSEYGENSCPRRCGEDYYPVCGQNEVGETKVFVNDCYMAVENCSGNNQLQQSGTHMIFDLRIFARRHVISLCYSSL